MQNQIKNLLQMRITITVKMIMNQITDHNSFMPTTTQKDQIFFKIQLVAVQQNFLLFKQIMQIPLPKK